VISQNTVTPGQYHVTENGLYFTEFDSVAIGTANSEERRTTEYHQYSEEQQVHPSIPRRALCVMLLLSHLRVQPFSGPPFPRRALCVMLLLSHLRVQPFAGPPFPRCATWFAAFSSGCLARISSYPSRPHPPGITRSLAHPLISFTTAMTASKKRDRELTIVSPQQLAQKALANSMGRPFWARMSVGSWSTKR